MNSVIISSKFQVVIPRKVRDSLKLKPGQKVRVIQYGRRIETIPAVETQCIASQLEERWASTLANCCDYAILYL